MVIPCILNPVACPGPAEQSIGIGISFWISKESVVDWVGEQESESLISERLCDPSTTHGVLPVLDQYWCQHHFTVCEHPLQAILPPVFLEQKHASATQAAQKESISQGAKGWLTKYHNCAQAPGTRRRKPCTAICNACDLHNDRWTKSLHQCRYSGIFKSHHHITKQSCSRFDKFPCTSSSGLCMCKRARWQGTVPLFDLLPKMYSSSVVGSQNVGQWWKHNALTF